MSTLSKGEEKNLLPNAVRLEILGGGQLCGFNEPTPTRNTKTHLRSLSVSALPLGDGKVASHQCLSVIPQRECVRFTLIDTLRYLKYNYKIYCHISFSFDCEAKEKETRRQRKRKARVSGRRRLDAKMAKPLSASTEDLQNANEQETRD